jgi:thiamine biosynthesis lipoprotein
VRQVVIPGSLTRVPARPPASECVELTGESMGTTWKVNVFAGAHAAPALRAAIEHELALVVQQMSHWEPGSDLSRFNQAPAGTRHVLPGPLFELLLHAQRVSVESGGAYDATMGAVVAAWGFGPDRACQKPGFEPPTKATLDAARARGNWQSLRLDPRDSSAFQPGSLQLDLSAIAKGFAVDQVSRRLVAEGCASHLVEIGGELRGEGVKPAEQPWWVALEPPDAATELDETLIALCDCSVATSGDYRRSFSRGGQRYAHTIDPRSGRPLDNDLAAVTVIADECWRADAHSTALMVLGADAGLAFADRYEVAARFVRRTESGFAESHSRAWAEMLS